MNCLFLVLFLFPSVRGHRSVTSFTKDKKYVKLFTKSKYFVGFLYHVYLYNYIGIIHRGLILVLYELSCSLDQATNYETTLLNYFTSLVKSLLFSSKTDWFKSSWKFRICSSGIGCCMLSPFL